MIKKKTHKKGVARPYQYIMGDTLEMNINITRVNQPIKTIWRWFRSPSVKKTWM